MSAGVIDSSAKGATEAPPPSEPAVEVEGLARKFHPGPRWVLRDVSFSVLPGRASGVAGANGSGKTVLLRLLASLDRPSAGRVRIYGDDTVRHALAVRRRVGYVPEVAMLYDGMTAHQYLHFVGRARGLGQQVRSASVDTLLEVVGLEHGRTRDLSTFSPGERRRLMLASALLHEPDVLLLDDPLRSLDGQSRLEQLEVLRELRRLGTTMVVVATRPEDLFEVCDDIAVLRDGTIAWRGDAAAAAMLGAPQPADAVRVRAEVLAGLDQAVALLDQRRDVRELEVDADGQTVWFLFTGDREALAGLLPQLVRAGCSLAHFGIERRSAASALSSLFRG
jgi:ABC-2 type transport system ATP-binding protein